MDQTAIDIARFQFAFTVIFHIIFPAFTIGLASYLAVLEGLWLVTGQRRYIVVFEYWLRIFAIVFGMGVVSGLVMSYQFGTNWSRFADKTGPVLGPLLGYEVLTAFFLEAGFLGVMLFGRKRVGAGLHLVATAMVAFGTLLSSFWILSANSWMHTPAGYSINAQGQYVPESWWAVIFNPSFPYRLVHMVLAAYLTTAFAVGAVGAWHLLKDKNNEAARVMFSMAMWMAIVVTPVQITAGDMHGLNTLQYQPMKIAAIEGHYETVAGAPLYLIGWPDNAAGETRGAIAIPKLGSLILAHDANATIKGLKEWPRADWPNAPLVFWSFRVMVGLGFLMLGLGVWSLVARARDGLQNARLLQRAAVALGPAGFAAVVAGWITTECGRQPFTVYNVLRTKDSVSPIAAPAVGSSLAAFVIVYLVVFGAGVFYVLRTMAKPPGSSDDTLDPQQPRRAAGVAPGPAETIAGPGGRN